MNARLDAALAHWSYVAPLLKPASNDEEYQSLVESLDAILDAGGADEMHPLASLALVVGDLVSAYETAHYPWPDATLPATRLAFLMEQHNLSQSICPYIRQSGKSIGDSVRQAHNQPSPGQGAGGTAPSLQAIAEGCTVK